MCKSYASRSALLAKEIDVSSNYKFTVWALPESKIEKSIIEFLKRRHPKSITLSMQGIVDEIRDFVTKQPI